MLALIYGRVEAIRRKTHCKGPLKKPLVKGQKVIAPEVCKSNIMWATEKGNNSLANFWN